MDINWVILGWLIDMILNGFVWLLIAIIVTPLMDIFDKWARTFIETSWEIVKKKNIRILSSAILLIIFGIFSQLGIIPKLIT
ncbi:MAG: hypothetical protein CMD68_05225 [Gammaproteobacteria bacterium]|nr:hypothetical protein [Gammaproteobacteria bacterium]|tara:strand:- start:4 stop:249 length:246 start_codon:yes stop_codon:yes gene_type:complete